MVVHRANARRTPNTCLRRPRRSFDCRRADHPAIACAAAGLAGLHIVPGELFPNKTRRPSSPRRSQNLPSGSNPASRHRKARHRSAGFVEVRRCHQRNKPFCLGRVVVCRRHREDEPALPQTDCLANRAVGFVLPEHPEQPALAGRPRTNAGVSQPTPATMSCAWMLVRLISAALRGEGARVRVRQRHGCGIAGHRGAFIR